MNVEEYLSQNKESIAKECETIASQGSKPIITLKKSDQDYMLKIGTVEEFTTTIPDNKFFKKMRDGITNAVINKVIPVVVFEGQKAQIISFSDYLDDEK